MNIGEKIASLKHSIPGHVKIAAVSKTQPVEVIRAAYDSGHRLFAENKVQELVQKQALLPADIEWHFIGHLQTNKVKYIASFVNVIQSVDSQRLLLEIDREARRHNRVIDCLLQFHIAYEETKFGLSIEEAVAILSSEAFRHLANIRLTGVMGMASFSDDPDLIRSEFRNLHDYFLQIRSRFFSQTDYFSELSMGMSGDYHLAITEGSTLIRIGTAIFGERLNF